LRENTCYIGRGAARARGSDLPPAGSAAVAARGPRIGPATGGRGRKLPAFRSRREPGWVVIEGKHLLYWPRDGIGKQGCFLPPAGSAAVAARGPRIGPATKKADPRADPPFAQYTKYPANDSPIRNRPNPEPISFYQKDLSSSDPSSRYQVSEP